MSSKDTWRNFRQRIGTLGSVWTRPRATVAFAQRRPSLVFYYIIAVLYGMALLLGDVIDVDVDHRIPDKYLNLYIFLGGPLTGIFTLHLFTFLASWISQLLQNKTAKPKVMTAVVYSMLPLVWLLPLMLFAYITMGPQLFLNHNIQLEGGNFSALLQELLDMPFSHGITIIISFALMPVFLIWTVYSIIISSKCMGQAMGSSAWKGFAVWTLTILVMILGGTLIGGILSLFGIIVF
ncbi:hypothetical protein K8I28_14825 [bacterium]|nr:hypothetical protein [bacterium]